MTTPTAAGTGSGLRCAWTAPTALQEALLAAAATLPLTPTVIITAKVKARVRVRAIARAAVIHMGATKRATRMHRIWRYTKGWEEEMGSTIVAQWSVVQMPCTAVAVGAMRRGTKDTRKGAMDPRGHRVHGGMRGMRDTRATRIDTTTAASCRSGRGDWHVGTAATA
jgi:hypothetical protein